MAASQDPEKGKMQTTSSFLHPDHETIDVTSATKPHHDEPVAAGGQHDDLRRDFTLADLAEVQAHPTIQKQLQERAELEDLHRDSALATRVKSGSLDAIIREVQEEPTSKNRRPPIVDPVQIPQGEPQAVQVAENLETQKRLGEVQNKYESLRSNYTELLKSYD